MYLKNVLENKYTIVSSAALILLPYYTWKSLYSNYQSLKRKYEEEILFRERHNCVVMYTGSKGMSGWPPYEERIVPDITTQNWCDILYEPIMYFLDTAKNTVDVAIMMISVKKIYQALINARRRNVKVRVLLNYEHCERMLPEIRKCIEEGIEVQLFISPKPNQASIMHYKFIVKDYSANSGYVLVGSMNFSESAFLENYEDLVISSNHYVAEGFHECFEKCLSFVKDDNESLINKMMLLDMNLT